MSSPHALLAQLPPIRRAREYRLYAPNGRRFLDFWQEGGAGLLGCRPPRVLLALKDGLSAGRSLLVPSEAERRALRAVIKLFPAYASSAAFPSAEAARAALAAQAWPCGEWRPFLPVPAVDALLVLPPLPLSLRPAFVLFKEKAAAAELESRSAGPCHCAAYQADAAVLALTELRRQEACAEGERALGWKAFDRALSPRFSAIFERNGPYVVTKTADYVSLFNELLAGGLLFPPSPDTPAIVPASFDPGELKALSN
jgi:hypothetical protein